MELKVKLIQQLMMVFIMVYKFRQLLSYSKSKHKSKVLSFVYRISGVCWTPKVMYEKETMSSYNLYLNHFCSWRWDGGESHFSPGNVHCILEVCLCSFCFKKDPKFRKGLNKFVATNFGGLTYFKLEIYIKKFNCNILREVIIVNITLPHKK